MSTTTLAPTIISESTKEKTKSEPDRDEEFNMKDLKNMPLDILITFMLSAFKTQNTRLDKDSILKLLDVLKKSILESPKNDVNDEERLTEVLKNSIENQSFKKITPEQKYLLLKSDKNSIWETILEISESQLKNKKYSTQYAPGWSYVPPHRWETHKKRVPVCINNSKEVSAPAFIFGSGVPANALELSPDDNINGGPAGAGKVGSMMPSFEYRETDEAVWFTDGVPDDSLLNPGINSTKKEESKKNRRPTGNEEIGERIIEENILETKQYLKRFNQQKYNELSEYDIKLVNKLIENSKYLTFTQHEDIKDIQNSTKADGIQKIKIMLNNIVKKLEACSIKKTINNETKSPKSLIDLLN